MQKLVTTDPDFSREFARVVDARRDADSDVAGVVQDILRTVRTGKDKALIEYTQRFDGYSLIDDADWLITPDRCAEAFDALGTEQRSALQLAADRIRAYHEAQLPENRDYHDAIGARLGAIWRPVDAAGLYVPGGRAAYPSSLLMNAIPARVAGVERVVVVTPTPKGNSNPLVLAAAHIAGIDEIWRVGGAQAVGALAYGTERIKPVDVVVGPGNAYVAEAKRQLYGVIGIDMVAGPSEILVVADGKNDPDWIAADLLSQAEHDPTSQSILITDDAGFAALVADCVDVQISQLATAKTAKKSWGDHGVIILVNDLEAEAPELVNALAAEHLELAIDDPEAMMQKVRHAGSIFL
ncbi:MAG: histidinol dehydrogenase, partial [Pseudomonadota bacterium]